ncbi:MAG: hypothetical protein Q9213_003043 [Squamulea squamosa]
MATFADQAPRLSTKPNCLSLEPRLPHVEGPFDIDCPVRLFWLNPHHNNDHSEIGRIRVLPTTDEILCLKRPYMPPKDAQDGTLERRGKARMLDVQFRHLRYDALEPVIDACYHASQLLTIAFKEPSPQDYDVRQQTVRGTQYSLFRGVRLEDARFEAEGIHLRLSFACPARLRQRRMLSSGHFESGMLMALIGLDTERTLSTAFLMVEMCQSTESMKPITGDHLRASVVASFVEPSDTNTIRQTLYGLKGLLNKERFVIVEFPKVLVAGFNWILKHLQFLSISNAEIAFSDLITPSSTLRNKPIATPAYSDRGSSSFDLSVLQEAGKFSGHSSLQLDPDFMASGAAKQQDIIENLCSTTTLDHGQATALCQNLSRELAFTQGPPGTGKTFLGVSLAKVILRHAPKKPILVACMTNHALDNFLSDLIKQGITKVARIGSGSKEEWMDKYTLPSMRKTFEKGDKSLRQKSKSDRAFNAVQALWTQGNTWCESLNTRTLTWAAVAEHLKSRYPHLYSDFSRYESPRAQKVSDIRQGRSEAGGYAFEQWSIGKDLTDTEEFSRSAGSFFSKSTAESQSMDGSTDSGCSSLDLSLNPPRIPVPYPYDDLGQSVWSMPMDVRAAWITRWKSELDSSSPIDKLAEIQRRYLEAKRIKRELFDQSDAKGLANQEVIGLTTTACAKYWPILKSLDLETLICEEAGEVSEAQTITTLLPSIKHAIFIGDPLQLRPQVNHSSLSLETTYGAKYRLDESLFERMVMPSTSGKEPVPVSKLDLQRRMHPDVAQLLRATLYPYLKDHPSTSHLPVAGMAHRTFWLDHQEPEDAPNLLSIGSKSYSNAFECAMICELVRYLLNTNDFDSGEIAILVPYSKQLACLKDKLTGTRACSIALSQKDKEDLIDMGLLDESELSEFRTDVEVSPMVRLATIDGFQGEEAKVIILSTVRSNLQDRVGFLQTTNRINVACSRARNGFYIVGNSKLLRSIDMWETVIADFEAKGRLDTSITTHCSRHPHLAQAVSKPHQFQQVLACNEPCNHVFNCGHGCPETCHEPVLHDRMFGRKMRMFARNVQVYRKNLQQGFEWFTDNFQPGPLSGEVNTAMIKLRMLYMMPLETDIVRYRDEVIVRVEADMARTAMYLGNGYAPDPISLSFKARLDLLYFHCRLTLLQEAARIIHFLRDFDNPIHTQHMAKTLKMLTIQQADENIAEAEGLVQYCRTNSLLRLEVETVLVQLCFDAVADRLGSIGDSLERHERAEHLMAENPDTAGILRPCYQSLDPETKGKDSTAELWTPKTREFWEKWGEYESGSLRHCKNGHPYSLKAFHDCPECGGRKVHREQIEDREEFVKNLDREMFLKAMARFSNQR